jgi:hypothetical protein
MLVLALCRHTYQLVDVKM